MSGGADLSSSGAYTVGFSKAVLAAHDAARHDVASGDLRPERQVYHDTFKSCGLLDTQLFCEANLGLYKVKPTFLPLLQKKLARRQKALEKAKKPAVRRKGKPLVASTSVLEMLRKQG